MLKTTIFSLLFTILSFGALPAAKSLDVFFGTGGRGAEGIYHATFNPEKGRFSPAKLAAEIGSPGFLAHHPDGKKIYAKAILAEHFPGREVIGAPCLTVTEEGGAIHCVTQQQPAR